MIDSDSQERYKLYFFRTLFRRKWFIIVVSLLGIAGTALGTYLSTPLYKATSKIMVKSNIAQEVVLFNDFYRQVPRSSNIIPANNFIEIAQSDIVARTIVDKYGLDKELQRKSEDPQHTREYFWYFVEKAKGGIKDVIKFPYDLYKKWVKGEISQEKPPDYRARAIKKFKEDMTDIDLVAESDIISLTVRAETPKAAEAIAKELANQVIQRSIEMEQNVAGYGYAFSTAELDKARNELSRMEGNLYEFRRKWDLSKIDRQKEIKLNELGEVERDIIAVNADLSAKKARSEEGSRQVSDQKKMLTSLDSYQNLLNERVALTVDINALAAKKKEYESARKKIQAALNGLVDKERELTRLEREVDLKKQFFNQLSSKHDELDVQRVSNLIGIDLRVIDTPEISESAEAAWPDWYVNMGIAIPVSIFLSVVFAFILDMATNIVWSSEQLEAGLDIPVLGTIREVRSKSR
ncbi:MAG: Wzz/FepE/Etk N-terminal domain-containing protein [Nitrospirota bacterium]